MGKEAPKRVKIPRLIDKAGIAELQDMLPPTHFRQIRRILAEFDAATDRKDFRGFQDRLGDSALSHSEVARYVRHQISQTVRTAGRGSRGMRADSRYMDLLQDRFDETSRLGDVSGFPLKGRRRAEDIVPDVSEPAAVDLGDVSLPEVSLSDLIREPDQAPPEEFVPDAVRDSDRMVQDQDSGPSLSLSLDGPPTENLVDSVGINGGDLGQDKNGIALDGIPDLSDQFEEVEAAPEVVPETISPKKKQKKKKTKTDKLPDKSSYYDARSKRIGDYISQDQKRGSVNIVEDAGSMSDDDDDEGF